MFGNGKETDPGKAGKKKMLLILLGAGVGILLLLLGSGWFSPSAKNTEEKLAKDVQEELDDYRTALEGRIRALCESVDGVDQVTVAVTLSGSFETVYATELRDGNEHYVTLGSGSSAVALPLYRTEPEIVGIGIVCRGGGNDNVRRELTSLLSSLFHIPSNRIYIAEAKKT